jgi:fructosamine-3-kinase
LNPPGDDPNPPWQDGLESAIGDRVLVSTPLSGGDVGESFSVDLASGARVFLKSYRGLPDGLAAAEARGLDWLSSTQTIRIAHPLAYGGDWLALEWIEAGPRTDDYDVLLGRGLARLHAHSAPEFGWTESNWVGRLPQPNGATATWAEFYASRRIQPLARRARDAQLLPWPTAGALDRLVEKLPDLVGPVESPARLHGDLWSGNVMVDERGQPCLIDPAPYAGHREMDLAMMKLFGGFSENAFRAYDEECPLADGAQTRLDLYQVYPLLVHVCLFGASYVGRLSEALENALSR